MTDERGLRVEELHKSYGDKNTQVAAVNDVSFEVPEGSFYTLLGPSGCGKTTTLRCVAGLERPNSGHIVLEGEAVWSSRLRTAVPPHRRDIGMVFQSYAIWPHMSVFDNVAFPLKVGAESVSGARIRERVEEALAMVQLGGYESRMATQLSGGQQQRLALARALVRRPKLLLLDEPLSNLDAKLRDELRTELRNLQRQLGITTLYVTHDQTEALSMSNTIAVMSEGRIVQEGSPRTIYQRPNSRFVATFVGGTNFVNALVLSTNGGGRATLQSPLGTLTATCPDGTDAGEEVTVAVRPENIRVHLDYPSATNVFAGTVEQVVFLGDDLDCRIRVGEKLLFTRQHPISQVNNGDEVYVELPVDLCAVLSDQHGTAAAAALGHSDPEPSAHAGR